MVGRKIKEQLHLFRPVQEGWEVWKRQKTWVLQSTTSLEELVKETAGPQFANAYFALPTRYVLAAPLWIPQSDPITARKMAEVELEIRGLIPKETELVSIHTIDVAENQMLICAHIFPEPFPSRFDCPLFSHFNANPQFAELEKDALHIWREGSDIVAVFTNGKEPVYWESLPFPASIDEFFTWIHCIYLPLKEGAFLPPTLQFINYLGLALPSPTFCGQATHSQLRMPPLCEKLPLCDWKSPSRRAIEKANKKRKVYALAASIIGSFYLFLMGIFLIWVGVQHFEVGRVHRKIEALEPAVHNTMEVQKQWSYLSPTIETSGFPIEILHLVVKQIPAEGMWLTQFEFDHQKVAVSGEAESVSIAAQFFADVSKVLPKIQWDMPPPMLLSNNRAKFVISGAP